MIKLLFWRAVSCCCYLVVMSEFVSFNNSAWTAAVRGAFDSSAGVAAVGAVLIWESLHLPQASESSLRCHIKDSLKASRVQQSPAGVTSGRPNQPIRQFGASVWCSPDSCQLYWSQMRETSTHKDSAAPRNPANVHIVYSSDDRVIGDHIIDQLLQSSWTLRQQLASALIVNDQVIDQWVTSRQSVPLLMNPALITAEKKRSAVRGGDGAR